MGFSNSSRRMANDRAKAEYSAWTNFTKRTDISIDEFIRLRDIHALR